MEHAARWRAGPLAVMRGAPEGLRARTVPAPGGPLIVYESDDLDRDLDHAIASGGPAPYGRVLWPSAHAAASALLALLRAHRAEHGVPPSVVELGCGTGLCALVAARAGAKVLATDVDQGALVAVRAAAIQFPGAQLTTALFDVCNSAVMPAGDIVMAADLLYEEDLSRAMARRAREALARGSIVIVGDPGRAFRPRFDEDLRDHGTVPDWRPAAQDGPAHGVAVAVLR